MFYEKERTAMSIYFDEKTKVFYLESKNLTYAFGINAIGEMEHIYFGKRVGRDLRAGIYTTGGRAHPICVVGSEEKKYDVTAIPKEISTPTAVTIMSPVLSLNMQTETDVPIFVLKDMRF